MCGLNQPWVRDCFFSCIWITFLSYLRVYLCTCLHDWGYMCRVHVICGHAWGLIVMLKTIVRCSLITHWSSDSKANPEMLVQLASLSSLLWAYLICLPRLEFQEGMADVIWVLRLSLPLDTYVGSGDLKSGPHFYMSRALTSKYYLLQNAFLSSLLQYDGIITISATLSWYCVLMWENVQVGSNCNAILLKKPGHPQVLVPGMVIEAMPYRCKETAAQSRTPVLWCICVSYSFTTKTKTPSNDANDN